MATGCGACGDGAWLEDEDTEPDQEPDQEPADDCGCPRIAGIRLGWWILALLVLLVLSRCGD